MQRVGNFWNGLTLASRLQYLAFAIVLGALYVQRDLNPANRVFGHPLWHLTLVLIVLMVIAGRLLLPLMMRFPTATRWMLGLFGVAVFVLSFYLATRRLILLTHLILTAALWLDASCSFWFISEVQRRAEQFGDDVGDETATGAPPPDQPSRGER